jgi:hypothetical protein
VQEGVRDAAAYRFFMISLPIEGHSWRILNLGNLVVALAQSTITLQIVSD